MHRHVGKSMHILNSRLAFATNPGDGLPFETLPKKSKLDNGKTLDVLMVAQISRKEEITKVKLQRYTVSRRGFDEAQYQAITYRYHQSVRNMSDSTTSLVVFRMAGTFRIKSSRLVGIFIFTSVLDKVKSKKKRLS